MTRAIDHDACPHLRACGLTIQALRGIERWGASELLERAFAGFAQLPPAMVTPQPWWEVLGVREGATFAEVRAAYERLSLQHHPDRGGEHERMVEINRAWERAQEEGGQRG